MAETFERVVPENAAVERERKDMAVATGVDDFVADDDGDVFVSGRAQNARLEFGAPDFGAGLEIDRRDVAVAADVKVLFHGDVLAVRAPAHDYNSIGKFHRVAM